VFRKEKSNFEKTLKLILRSSQNTR